MSVFDSYRAALKRRLCAGMLVGTFMSLHASAAAPRRRLHRQPDTDLVLGKEQEQDRSTNQTDETRRQRRPACRSPRSSHRASRSSPLALRVGQEILASMTSTSGTLSSAASAVTARRRRSRWSVARTGLEGLRLNPDDDVLVRVVDGRVGEARAERTRPRRYARRDWYGWQAPGLLEEISGARRPHGVAMGSRP